VIWLHTPTVFCLGGGTISLSYWVDMGLMMLGKHKYIQQNHWCLSRVPWRLNGYRKVKRHKSPSINQIHPLPAQIHMKNALTSPRHQPLRSHTHFWDRNQDLSTLEYPYSMGRTRRETLPNTPHTSIPDTKNGSFQRDWNHTTKARPLHLSVSVDNFQFLANFHSDRAFHCESTT